MRKDNKLLYSVVLASVLIVLHSWQFVKSNYDVKPLVNLIMAVVYIPVILIFGFDALPLFLASYGFIYIPFESFDNYTSLFLLCSAISLNKRLNKLISFYILETIIWYMIEKLQISHLGVSLCYIIFMLNVYVIIQDSRIKPKPLCITDDEKFILEQLLSGKEIKEVQGFSQNTVYKKLRNARERNACITNNELLMRYKDSK